MIKMSNNQSIICFGEMLWDLLPTGKVEGGAPMNVACHAARLGHLTRMISRVGDDELGHNLVRFLGSKNVNVQAVQFDPVIPTGTVEVTLDALGAPSYEIVYPSAWDFIQVKSEEEKYVRGAGAFVFGSLICREKQSCTALFKCLELAQLKVFDVNLRPPFYSEEGIQALLLVSNIVKMNLEELEVIAGWSNYEGTVEQRMKLLFERFGWNVLVVTLGSGGAYAYTSAGFCYEKGVAVPVVDTIGSGDAFLAGFIHYYLQEKPTGQALRYANALGAFNALFSGGTPVITEGAFEAFCAENQLIIDFN
jgi:fructokinase